MCRNIRHEGPLSALPEAPSPRTRVVTRIERALGSMVSSRPEGVNRREQVRHGKNAVSSGLVLVGAHPVDNPSGLSRAAGIWGKFRSAWDVAAEPNPPWS